MFDLSGGIGIHAGLPIARAGAAMEQATGALVLVHGRGADAGGMLDLGRTLATANIACLAPQAAGHVWYPRRFIEPVANNEPDLSSALSVLDDLVARLGARFTAARVGLLGFSQGACLSLEFARRHGQPLAGVIGFSGGLIGEAANLAHMGGNKTLADMPVLLGCSENDPHIPAGRVRETQGVFDAMGATVTTLLYPGNTHTVTTAEIRMARGLLAARLGPPAQ